MRLKRAELSRFHLTCLTSTKEKIDSVLDELEANGIENVLALRGDIPKDFEMGENQYFHHAFELVNEIKARGKFCVGAACYPETHLSLKTGLMISQGLRKKLTAVSILSQLKCF